MKRSQAAIRIEDVPTFSSHFGPRIMPTACSLFMLPNSPFIVYAIAAVCGVGCCRLPNHGCLKRQADTHRCGNTRGSTNCRLHSTPAYLSPKPLFLCPIPNLPSPPPPPSRKYMIFGHPDSCTVSWPPRYVSWLCRSFCQYAHKHGLWYVPHWHARQ